jgi:hypothetical protein
MTYHVLVFNGNFNSVAPQSFGGLRRWVCRAFTGHGLQQCPQKEHTQHKGMLRAPKPHTPRLRWRALRWHRYKETSSSIGSRVNFFYENKKESSVNIFPSFLKVLT